MRNEIPLEVSSQTMKYNRFLAQFTKDAVQAMGKNSLISEEQFVFFSHDNWWIGKDV